MTPQALRSALLEDLIHIAPDIDPATVADSDHLQNDLALDSLDFLRLVTAIHTRLGVDVPEADYGFLATLGSAVPYLQAKLKS